MTINKRLVIKVGTSTLTNSDGAPDIAYIAELATEITELMSLGYAPILVSSGAIAAGMLGLRLKGHPKTIPQKQAAAAVGQGLLMHLYSVEFGRVGATVAQMLLTRDDLHDRTRYVNARNTLKALLQLEAIPIINENDTVAVDEIRFGDNDTLAAMVAAAADASELVILSDVDGLYTANPALEPQASIISVIAQVDKRIEEMAGGAGTVRGTGGMRAKINAARICTRSGVTMYIANGREPNAVRRALAGEIGSKFLPSSAGPLKSRKRWMAFGTSPAGVVTINTGATNQLLNGGKSLLPAGVIEVSGNFAAGETVAVVDENALPVARGIVNYSSDALRQIMGKQSSSIEETLGEPGPDEVVHRDNLVITGQP